MLKSYVHNLPEKVDPLGDFVKQVNEDDFIPALFYVSSPLLSTFPPRLWWGGVVGYRNINCLCDLVLAFVCHLG